MKICLSILTIAFVFLKLSGQVAWPWIWVLGPIWIPLLLVVCFESISAVIGIRLFRD